MLGAPLAVAAASGVGTALIGRRPLFLRLKRGEIALGPGSSLNIARCVSAFRSPSTAMNGLPPRSFYPGVPARFLHPDVFFVLADPGWVGSSAQASSESASLGLCTQSHGYRGAVRPCSLRRGGRLALRRACSVHAGRRRCRLANRAIGSPREPNVLRIYLFYRHQTRHPTGTTSVRILTGLENESISQWVNHHEKLCPHFQKFVTHRRLARTKTEHTRARNDPHGS